MLTLGVETIVILLVIMGVVSAFGGYVFAQERQRRAGGGKSAAELRKELSEYKENVNTHFQTTAGLLHDMTEQYRAVYEHMASGAQNLCDPDTARTQIESLRAGLLPAGSPAADAEPAAEAIAVPATNADAMDAGQAPLDPAAQGPTGPVQPGAIDAGPAPLDTSAQGPTGPDQPDAMDAGQAPHDPAAQGPTGPVQPGADNDGAAQAAEASGDDDAEPAASGSIDAVHPENKATAASETEAETAGQGVGAEKETKA